MNQNIEDVIQNSADSELLTYLYENMELTIRLKTWDDETLELKLKTTKLAVNPRIKQKNSSRTCFIELLDLRERLLLENGYYRPPNDFVNLMKDVRSELTIGYGLKSNINKYLFTLRSSDVLVACIVEEKSDILCSVL